MIFKRAVAKLRAQDWTAISIELAIVVVGVFIGIWVANWNQERVKKQETREMLVQLKPELLGLRDLSSSTRNYYAVTGRYADTAFAGGTGTRMFPTRSSSLRPIRRARSSASTTMGRVGRWSLAPTSCAISTTHRCARL